MEQFKEMIKDLTKHNKQLEKSERILYLTIAGNFQFFQQLKKINPSVDSCNHY